MSRAVARLVVAAVVASTAGTVATIVAPTAALADTTYQMESEFVAKMNSARQANGLRPYTVASDLTSIARQHSADMAAKQTLYHNPDLTTQVQNWQAVGENVGEGPTVSDIHTAFMNSPEHRANILDHDFTQVGVGVTVDKNGIIWVTEDFREPMYATTTSSGGGHSSGTTTSSSSAPVSSTVTSAPSAPSAPAPSPRALLLKRLHQVRHSRPVVRPVDPVAQAIDYAASLSQLTS